MHATIIELLYIHHSALFVNQRSVAILLCALVHSVFSASIFSLLLVCWSLDLIGLADSAIADFAKTRSFIVY